MLDVSCWMIASDKCPFSPHILASPCSGPADNANATGRLEVTCTKCKAWIEVTAHSRTTASQQTNQFAIKKSMHKPSCSLSKEQGKMATLSKLPSLGNTVTVNKGAFSAKRI